MPLPPPSPIGRILPRRAGALIEAALADTRVVLVNGARQSGKSTLVAQVTTARQAEWRTWSDSRTQAAEYEWTSTSPAPTLIVMDEVPGVLPELFLAIKEAVNAGGTSCSMSCSGSGSAPRSGVAADCGGRLFPRRSKRWNWSRFRKAKSTLTGPRSSSDTIFDVGPDLAHTCSEPQRGMCRRMVHSSLAASIARARSGASIPSTSTWPTSSTRIIQLSEISTARRCGAPPVSSQRRSGQLLYPARSAASSPAPADDQRSLGLFGVAS